MRARRVSLLIGVVVVALAGVGCSSSGESADGPSNTTGPPTTVADRPIRVPGGFGTGAVAASDDWVVGLRIEPYTGTKPSTVTAVDLHTRKVKTFPGPVDGDIPIDIIDLVAADDGFVGVGNGCASPDDIAGCGPTNVLVRLDPATGTWQTEDLPLEPPGDLDGLHVVDGDVILVDWTGESLRVTRLDATGGATPVAMVSTGSRVGTCVAGDDLWLFRKHSGGGVAYALWRVDLDDGATDQIALPELADYFGGVTTSFGCDATGPVVTSTPPGGVPPSDADSETMQAALTGVTVWRRADGAWQRFASDELAKGAVVDEVVSGDRPVLLGGRSDGPGDSGRFAALLADEKLTDLPTGTFDTYLWRGDTGDLLHVSSEDGKRHIEVIDTDD